MRLLIPQPPPIERLQCYEGISEDKAIGNFNEPLQKLFVDLNAKASEVDWQSMHTKLRGEHFFSAGPPLRALQYVKPCVLLIDELDKVGAPFEAQSFKRAASCFGLGRYLYYFTGVWVDLDELRRPTAIQTALSASTCPLPVSPYAEGAGWQRSRVSPESTRQASSP
jgi:hypothetical protein